MSLRDNLLAATGLKQKKNENDETFRQRLIEAVSDLNDEDYRTVPKAARRWADAAIKQFNESGEVPLFDDEGEEEQEEDAAEEGDETETETSNSDEEEDDMPTTQTETRSRRNAPPPRKAVSGKTKAKGAAPKARDNGGSKARSGSGGGLVVARRLLAQNPEMSVADLHQKVKKAGHDISTHTLSTTKSGFLATVKVLQEEGHLKKRMV